jgi:hypothetical protein
MPSWEQIHNEIKVLALLCRFESDSNAGVDGCLNPLKSGDM